MGAEKEMGLYVVGMYLEVINPLMGWYSLQRVGNLVLWTFLHSDFEEFISPRWFYTSPEILIRRIHLQKKVSRKPNKPVYSKDVEKIWHLHLFHFLPYYSRQILITQTENSVLKPVLLNTLTGMFTCRESSKYSKYLKPRQQVGLQKGKITLSFDNTHSQIKSHLFLSKQIIHFWIQEAILANHLTWQRMVW